MTTQVPRLTAALPRPRRARATAWAVPAAVGACLLAAGCSSTGGASSGGTSAGTAGAPAALHEPAAGCRAVRAASSAAAKGAGLTALPLPGGQAVVFTATLSLRAENVQATAARATRLAEAAGGYVSGEHATITQSRHARSMVSIQ